MYRNKNTGSPQGFPEQDGRKQRENADIVDFAAIAYRKQAADFLPAAKHRQGV